MVQEEQSRLSEIARKRLGTTLRGKYRLDAVLGVGGMAVVYKATHRNQAEYAIKMLLPEHTTNEHIRRRFLREGYAANSVKHPGAVQVVDDDVSEDGAAFLVLELLEGMPCDALSAAQGGKLPLDAVVSVASQVLQVLEAAHAKEIIHRDIKPANLFVVRDGAVKVLDFGIARVKETMAGGTHTTGGGMLLGTPAFMAPEQAIGRASDVDARADLWALGATFFSLISGATVHEGESGQQLLVHLVTRPARSLAVAAPEVPPALVEVVDRALLFDRDRRFASALAMRKELEEAWERACGGLPSRATLVQLVESASARSARTPTVAREGSSAAGSPGAAGVGESVPSGIGPTLPEAGAKAVVETSRPVSRDGRSLHTARRSAIAVASATLAVGALTSVTTLIALRRREPPAESPASRLTSQAPSAPNQDVPGAAAGPDAPVREDPAGSGHSPSSGAVQSAVAPWLPSSSPRAPAANPPGRLPERSEGTDTNPTRTSTTSPRSGPAASVPMPAAGATAGETETAGGADAAPNCKPPFYYDSAWNRVFKKECLRP